MGDSLGPLFVYSQLCALRLTRLEIHCVCTIFHVRKLYFHLFFINHPMVIWTYVLFLFLDVNTLHFLPARSVKRTPS